MHMMPLMTTTKAKARTTEITVAEAEALFAELRDSLVNAERVTIRIIETEAWRRLGYDSFAEAWSDRMAGVRLATDVMKAHVVYALLESASVDEISAQTRVRPDIVKILKRQKGAGVPARNATARRPLGQAEVDDEFSAVRRHMRRKRGSAKTIHVTVTVGEYADWVASARARGTNLADESAAVLRCHFAAVNR